MNEASEVRIETKLAYVEAALETLSDVVVQQQRRIEQLEALGKTLAARIESARLDDYGGGDPLSEKPPHY